MKKQRKDRMTLISMTDRFGSKLETKQISDDNFSVTVEVSLSPPFYAWVFQFNGDIKILSPNKAVKDITKMAEAITKR